MTERNKLFSEAALPVKKLSIIFLAAGLSTGLLSGCSDSVRVSSSESTESVPTDETHTDTDTTPKTSLAQLGELIFEDTNLSSPAGQSCSSCHNAETGFVDPDAEQPSSLGANGGDFGTRNTPTVFYTAQIPEFQIANLPHPATGELTDFEFGGLFMDGRAKTLEDQVIQPFFNPVEMALHSSADFASKIYQSDYSGEFRAHFGQQIFDDGDATVDAAAVALTAFHKTPELSPFNSKFDQVQQGNAHFSEEEARGESLFSGKALCSVCHSSPSSSPEVFSDFLYHNLGVPSNQQLLSTIGDPDFVDLGLGALTHNVDHEGQFRTPTLRNISLTAPYMHNGVFNTLSEVVSFYNTGSLSSPEAPRNNIPPFIGNLGLSAEEEKDIVAFLKTLTDD